jgi:hypothetical protein
LHLGKPIPRYSIVNGELKRIDSHNLYRRLSDGESFSLEFQNAWMVPVMSDEAPLLFRNIMFSEFGGNDILRGTKNIIEHFRNYEYKDSIIGSVSIATSIIGIDELLIIRKENQDIFVEIYDEVTGEYFKNEYRFSELLNLLKDLNLRAKEKRMRYYEKVANKSELKITPEITEMVVNDIYSRFRDSLGWSLSSFGIKDRAQLEHLYLEKPIPLYAIVDENLTFTGRWEVPVMSNGEPILFTWIRLEDDGQYILAGGGSAKFFAETIHNYEYKNLIIGYLGAYTPSGINRSGYLIIRKDNQDIFVQMSGYGGYLKNEYSFNEVLNLLKQ